MYPSVTSIVPNILSCSISRALRLSIIDNEFYPTNEKYEILKQLTISDFKQYANRFLKELKIQALFQGNLNQETAQTVMNNVLDQLQPQPIDNVRYFKWKLDPISVLRTSINSPVVSNGLTSSQTTSGCSLSSMCVIQSE